MHRFEEEVKCCGEHLQRHAHRDVCYKYGHNSCRFNFPHEYIPHSYYDKETQSVITACLDVLMDYYNDFITVYCRHNHDMKCILSGRSCKAAMYYITDYITKMSLKMYEILSLL
ncbi:hypothetical protein IW261DRAFT_1346411, partial [Armillaria novae-zelandiae]